MPLGSVIVSLVEGREVVLMFMILFRILWAGGLERLSKLISKHQISQTVLDKHVLSIHSVLPKDISDVYMACWFGTG